MTVYNLRRLYIQHSEAARECKAKGFRTIGSVNQELADYYLNRAASLKAEFEQPSDES